MRATSICKFMPNNLLRVLVASALLSLSACGSSDNAVNSDGGESGGGGAGDGGAGSGDGGDDGNNGSGGDGGGNGGGNTGGNTGSGNDPVTGDTLMPVPSATPASRTYSCKSEAPDEDDVALNLELTFDPATLEFLVDGDLVLTGGFTWNEESAEWVAQTSTFLVDDANLEIFTKVASDNAPTYFRRKLTQTDFSFVQTECYRGLTIGGE
jgi:hypothetical protein